MASGSVSQTLGPGDVVNNLTSTSTTAPLSANMGKQLNDNLIKQKSFSVEGTVGTTVIGNTGLYNATVALPSIPQGATFLGVIIRTAYDTTYYDKNVFASVYNDNLVIWAGAAGRGVHVNGYILYM